MGYGPAFLVDGPLPVAPMYTLVKAAQVIDEPDEYWINGTQQYPYPCAGLGTHDPCAEGSAAGSKGSGTAVVPQTFGSYAVYMPEKCTTRGVWDQESFKRRAELVLGAVESSAVENELWMGTRVPANPFFTKAGATLPNASTLVSPMNGLAFLEAAIAATGRAGMIHVTTRVAVALSSLWLIEKDGPLLRTTGNGTIVVPGSGYPGSAPSGGTAATGTQDWAFATGMVVVRRSGIFLVPDDIKEATDRAQNDVVYRAERYYNVIFDDCVRAAVRIDRCQVTC